MQRMERGGCFAIDKDLFHFRPGEFRGDLHRESRDLAAEEHETYVFVNASGRAVQIPQEPLSVCRSGTTLKRRDRRERPVLPPNPHGDASGHITKGVNRRIDEVGAPLID